LLIILTQFSPKRVKYNFATPLLKLVQQLSSYPCIQP